MRAVVVLLVPKMAEKKAAVTAIRWLLYETFWPFSCHLLRVCP